MAHVRDGGLTRQEIGASGLRDANPSAAVKVSQGSHFSRGNCV